MCCILCLPCQLLHPRLSIIHSNWQHHSTESEKSRYCNKKYHSYFQDFVYELRNASQPRPEIVSYVPFDGDGRGSYGGSYSASSTSYSTTSTASTQYVTIPTFLRFYSLNFSDTCYSFKTDPNRTFSFPAISRYSSVN